jgi:hypothetical protein
MEEQCSNEVDAGMQQDMQSCMAHKSQIMQQMGQSLQNTGQQLNQQRGGNVDLRCKNDCMAMGYMMQFCQNKCSY